MRGRVPLLRKNEQFWRILLISPCPLNQFPKHNGMDQRHFEGTKEGEAKPKGAEIYVIYVYGLAECIVIQRTMHVC